MQAVGQIEAWPVPHAAAAVVVAAGAVAVAGDADRRYRWASVTKLVSALVVLIAIEEGSVELDGPAGPPGASVRHLLAHASGLPFEGEEPRSPVGRRRIYSNTGFEALAAHLAQRTGMPFVDYVREAVLEPLGMTASTLDPDEPHGAAAAGGYGPLRDLVRFAQELLRPRLVAAETLAEATAVAFPGLDGVLPGYGRQQPCDWGLGFELRDGKSPHWTGTRNSPRTFGHFGGSGTFLWVDPERDLAVVCLTDREFGEWALESWPALSDAVLAEHS